MINAVRWQTLPESKVINPSDMIGFGDAIMRPQNFGTYNSIVDNQYQELPWGEAVYWGDDQLINLSSEYKALRFGVPADEMAVQAMKKRHGGKWNVVFCDGHVESLRPIDLFDMTNVVVAQRWNYDHQPRDWLLPPPPSN